MANWRDYNKQIEDLQSEYPAARTALEDAKKAELGYNERMANLDSIKQNAMNTDKLLTDLPQNLQQRTAGRLMTAGQLGRLTASEAEPLTSSLANLNRRQSIEQEGLTQIQNMVNQALAQKEFEYQNRLQELSSIRDYEYRLQAQRDAEAAARQLAIDQLNNFGQNDEMTEIDTDDMTIADFRDRWDNGYFNHLDANTKNQLYDNLRQRETQAQSRYSKSFDTSGMEGSLYGLNGNPVTLGGDIRSQVSGQNTGEGFMDWISSLLRGNDYGTSQPKQSTNPWLQY